MLKEGGETRGNEEERSDVRGKEGLFSFITGAGQMTCLTLVSTGEEYFGEACLSDPSNCEWALRQKKPAMWTCR